MAKTTVSGSQGQVERGDGTLAVVSAGTGMPGLVQFDGTTANIQSDGNQSAGSNGLAADSGHVHPVIGDWTPARNNLIGANFPLSNAVGTGSALTAGTLYLAKLPIYQNLTITNLALVIDNGGSGASTGTFVGLYNSSGTLLSGSSDVAAGIAGFNFTYPLTTPQALAGGTFVWAAILVNLASTQPQLATAFASTTNSNLANKGVTAATANFSTNGTLITSLPASITPSSNTLTGSGSGPSFWCGYS